MRVVKEFNELRLQITDLSEKKTFFLLMDELKIWVKQELKCRGVQELLKVIIMDKFLIELVSRKEV